MNFFEKAQQMKENAEKEKKDLQSKTHVELIEELDRAKTIRDSKRNAEELTKELYRRAIENIKIGEMERTRITKHNFEDKDEVIDILLYVVGKLSQDPIFYKINIRKLKDHTPIYKKEAE